MNFRHSSQYCKVSLKLCTKNPSNTTHIFLIPQEKMPSSCRGLDQVMNCNDFSNLGRLCRVTCYIYRFIRNVRCRISRNHDALPKSRVLAAEEMNNAWNRSVQSKVFVKEFQSITTGCASNYVRQFGLYADECGVLRCKRRIGHANRNFI